MKRTMIKDLKESVGKRVLVKGWIHEIRDHGRIVFILLRDSSGIVQAVVSNKNKGVFNNVSDLTRESVICVSGRVKKARIKSDEVTERDVEIIVEKCEPLSLADKLPIQVVLGKEKADLSTRLDWRWIDLRKPRNFLVFRVWTCMEKAMRDFWLKNGFVQIHSPKFMGAPSESGSELFGLDYFGKKAYLAQSPQLYKQMAMAAGFEKVFEIGPVFRANPSHTTRHDTEFTSVDVEISFIDSHEDIMRFEEEWIVHTMKQIKKELGKEIRKVFGIDVTVPKLPFPRLTMKEAMKLLKQRGYSSKTDSLDAKGEKAISEIVKKRFGHDFIFVTDYPWSERPFYHMRKESDKNLTKSFDLIWNGLEITTGAQREHRYNILRKQAVEKKVALEPLKDYLNFFRYGCPPHGGFGLSPTRMLMMLLDMKNVREVTFMPRDTERLNP